MSKGKKQQDKDAFMMQVREALDHFHNPTWLGNRSPLAAPYFVEPHAIRPFETDTVRSRGQMLCRLLLEAAIGFAEQRDEERLKRINLRVKLEEHYANYQELYFNHLKEQLKAGSYDQQLLFLRYFSSPVKSNIDLQIQFPISSATLYRHIDNAIKQLSTTLISLAVPALRLEAPPKLRPIVGRETIIASCLEALRTGKTIALSGLGGVGKTTLGAYLVSKLGDQPVFWFTLRPGVNDHLHSILFSLSHFLQRVGTGSAFQKLIADQGKINLPLIQSLIQEDLERVHPLRPVLCFDELDLLQPTTSETHAQILIFLESLHASTPMLLIGQHLPIEADIHQSLDGLDRTEFDTMLGQTNIDLSDEQLTELHQHLRGNPRLLELFIIVYQPDDSLPKLIQSMAQSPSIESLLNRVWRRLSSGECDIALELAVFRSYAPSDTWQAEQQDLASLIERKLVQDNGRGGVALLPAFRTILYNLIPAESRETLHHKAALVRSKRGEVTAAAYHYINADRLREAILLWDEHRVQEINQGQGEAALEMFKGVSINQVSAQARERLVLLRGELQKRAGDYPGALQTLQLISWQTPRLKVRAKGLEGDIYDLQNNFAQAIAAYEEGLSAATASIVPARRQRQRTVGGNTDADFAPLDSEDTLSHVLEPAYFHRRLSRMYLRQRLLNKSWQEALRARYEVEDFQGVIQEYKGNHTEALTYYRSALAIAQECGYVQGEAKTRNNLLRLLVFRGAFDEAFIHGQEAYRLFHFVGDRANQASVRVNQALGYNQAGQPKMATELATEALTMFEQLGEPWGRAVAHQNLAEAHLALGNLPMARQYVERVLSEEETNTIPDTLRTWGEIELKEAQHAIAQGDEALAAKRLASAEQHIQQSLSAALENKDAYLEGYGWRALGNVHLAQGNTKEAMSDIEAAIALFNQLGLPHEVAITRHILG